MLQEILHVFRNTPFGRENFLQTLYFSRLLGLSVRIYIPKHKSFLMYFPGDVVQVDLDDSYLISPDTAPARAQDLADAESVAWDLLEPRDFTASTLPDLPVDLDFMSCPRSMTDHHSKIGPGYIGPKVRKLIQGAPFPILIPSICFKKWKSVTVFFGGSANAMRALRLGLKIREQTGLPLDVLTQTEPGTSKEDLEHVLAEHRLLEAFEESVREWKIFSEGKFRENLYSVPHDSLAVVGAYGHGLVKELLFGSKLETIQETLSNSLLVVGPRCEI